MSIEVRNLNKRFGATVVCDNLSLDIPAGELVAQQGGIGDAMADAVGLDLVG